MAETIGRAYIKILADGTGLDKSVEREMRKANRQAEKSGEDLGEHWADGFDRSIQKQRQDIMKSVDKAFADVDERGAVLGKGFGDNFGKEIARRIRAQFPELEKRAGDLGERIGKAFLSDFAKTGAGDFDLGVRLQVALRELHDEMDRGNPKVTRFIEGMDELGDSIGRTFGKGSRNNFLNFFGSLIGNISRLPGLVATAGLRIVEFGRSIADAFTEAPNAVQGFVAAAGKIAPAIGGAIVGFVALVTALGVVTSAFLLAAGAAAALVSTIAFGLVGAIAPLVGLLGPLGLAAGGVALAFIGMSDAAKEATKETFEPLKDQLKALGDAARPGILDGITAAVENLEAPMKRLEPLFEVVGDSIGKFIDAASKFSFGPGFQFFVDTMLTSLPDTMKSLGTSFGQTFDGLMGLFANLQPVTDVFLNSLERISGAFADWAISPDTGTFFDHAASSASALLDFLGPVWDLTQEILGAGRETGDSLFKSMGDTISGWVDTLRANPDILKDFFDDAKKMGEAIGNVIIEVGKLIDALDTPLHREWAIGFINAVGDLIGLIATLVGWFGKLDGSMQALVFGAGIALTAFTKISGGILTLGGNLRNAETRMGTLAGAARAAAGGAGLGLLIDGLTRTDGALSVLETTAGGAITGFSVGGPWGLAIGAAAGLLAGVAKEARDAKSAVEEAGEGASDSAGEWDNLKESLNQVTGAFTEQSRAAIFDQLTKDKTMKQFTDLGLSASEVVDAFMGVPIAAGKLESALAGVDTQLASNRTRLDEVQEELRQLSGQGGTSPRIGPLKEEEQALIDVIGEQENLRETLDSEREKAEADAQAIRERAAATVDWKNKLAGFPKQIITLFENENTLPKSIEDAKRLIAGYKNIQSVKKVRTLFEALGIEKSDKQIKRLLDRIKEAGRQKPKIPVEANAKPFEDTLAGIKGKIADLPKKPGKAKFDADDSKFNTKNQGVRNKLNETDKKTATPKITVDNTQAMTNIQNVQTGLNNLPTDKYITIHVNTVRTGGKPTASGGIFAGAQTRLIGEAGPEAVVPLSRPLSLVDPAVRELSAIAQGMRLAGQQQRPVAQRVIDVGGIQIITPTKDPGAVAQEMVNRLVAVGY